MDPRLDSSGRPWRLDSEWAWGMPVGAFMWMQQPPFVLDRARHTVPTDQEPPEIIRQAMFVPEFKVATTNSQLEPGMRRSYPPLPFRALEEICLPIPIQQKWEASVAASKCAEWRLWFQSLNETQQKTHVHSLSKSTKDTFWAGLWLEYEEWTKPLHTRVVAASARALILIEREKVRKQMREAQESLRQSISQLHFEPRTSERYELVEPGTEALPRGEPLSAPLTPHDIDCLRLRLAPRYFRLPASAFRFATQIFSGNSYEEALAEQRANFNSWTKENKVQRIEGQPDYVVWGQIAVHKNAVPKLTPKKKQPQTGKHRYQKKQPRVTREEGC